MIFCGLISHVDCSFVSMVAGTILYGGPTNQNKFCGKSGGGGATILRRSP